jgi:hypothetical protein
VKAGSFQSTVVSVVATHRSWEGGMFRFSVRPSRMVAVLAVWLRTWTSNAFSMKLAASAPVPAGWVMTNWPGSKRYARPLMAPTDGFTVVPVPVPVVPVPVPVEVVVVVGLVGLVGLVE